MAGNVNEWLFSHNQEVWEMTCPFAEGAGTEGETLSCTTGLWTEGFRTHRTVHEIFYIFMARNLWKLILNF